MKKISVIKNTVQEYEWGSFTAIPKLLGQKDKTHKPQAELWMGAHPKAPSMVRHHNEWISLTELISSNPEDILGKGTATRFKNKLPFLFKVLAAEKPLSIQAHPSLDQAKDGYERENDIGISLNAPNRNYKDANHKPECICALTPFWALNGFRRIEDILSLMELLCSQELDKLLYNLKQHPNADGLKTFFHDIITIESHKKEKIIHHTIPRVQHLLENGQISNYGIQTDKIFEWMIKLYDEYPNDIGIFAPIILNLIRLEPGQAMYLPSGELHAYLYGLGIELMANSDNVLRGGLTPKHIDVPELLNVLTFQERNVEILKPVEIHNCEKAYPTHSEEFILSIISVDKTKTYLSPNNRGAEILLCTDGMATISEGTHEKEIDFGKGKSVIIPAAVEQYEISGEASIYKAAVPV